MGDNEKIPITSIAERMVAQSQKLTFHPVGPAGCKIELPSRNSCLDIMQQLRSILFPGYFRLAEISENVHSFFTALSFYQRTGYIIGKQSGYPLLQIFAWGQFINFSAVVVQT